MKSGPAQQVQRSGKEKRQSEGGNGRRKEESKRNKKQKRHLLPPIPSLAIPPNSSSRAYMPLAQIPVATYHHAFAAKDRYRQRVSTMLKKTVIKKILQSSRDNSLLKRTGNPPLAVKLRLLCRNLADRPQLPCSCWRRGRTEKVREKKTRNTQQSKKMCLLSHKISALSLGMVTEEQQAKSFKEKEQKTWEFWWTYLLPSAFSFYWCVICQKYWCTPNSNSCFFGILIASIENIGVMIVWIL